MSSSQRTPPKHRRLLQYSLRTLFIFTLIVAGLCAWFRRATDRSRAEARAVEELRRLGADVEFFDFHSGASPQRELSRDLIIPYRVTVQYWGDSSKNVLDQMHSIRRPWRLFLDGSSVDDEDLAEVAAIGKLEVLGLRATAISDAGIRRLRTLHRLISLDLAHTKATNRCLQSLRELPRLQHLNVAGTYVTEAPEEIERWMADFGWVTWGPAQSEEKRLAAIDLERKGADVFLYVSEDRRQLNYHISISGSTTPRGWIGNSSDFACLAKLQPVHLLCLKNINLDDDAVENLTPVVRQLQTLSMFDVSTDDRRLRRLLGAQTAEDTREKLENLTLRGTSLTDQGMRSLQSLVNLKRLNIEATPIGDNGLVHAEGLKKLDTLLLSATRVTDDGLSSLTSLKNLRRLDLSRTALTDAGLKRIARLASLQELNLDSTQITDAGLRHLGRLTNLEALVVSNTQISDTGLDHLGALSNLRFLAVGSTQVTPAGAAKLKKALPELRISF